MPQYESYNILHSLELQLKSFESANKFVNFPLWIDSKKIKTNIEGHIEIINNDKKISEFNSFIKFLRNKFVTTIKTINAEVNDNQKNEEENDKKSDIKVDKKKVTLKNKAVLETFGLQILEWRANSINNVRISRFVFYKYDS